MSRGSVQIALPHRSCCINKLYRGLYNSTERFYSLPHRDLWMPFKAMEEGGKMGDDRRLVQWKLVKSTRRKKYNDARKREMFFFLRKGAIANALYSNRQKRDRRENRATQSLDQRLTDSAYRIFWFSTSFWAVAFHYDERSTAGQVRVHQQSSSAGDDGIADSLFDSPGSRWSHRKASGQKRHEREREKLDNRQCARPLASCNAGRRRKKKGEKKLTSRGSI